MNQWRFLCVFILSFFTSMGMAGEETASPYCFRGTHFLANYSGCDKEALESIEQLKQVMLEAVQKCGATVLDHITYLFPPNGLTMVILLSESHASIHTYPEHGACFIDLFTCGEKCSSVQFDQILQSYLRPSKVDARQILRDEDMSDDLAQKSASHAERSGCRW